jgi:hypothetical protein
MTETHEWGGVTFTRIARLDPKRGPGGSPMEFMPQARYAKAATSVLNTHGAGPFCKFGIPWSQGEAGVYIITLDEQAVYVGECRHLAQRFNMGYGTIQPKNCYVGGQSTNCKVNSKVLNAARAGEAPVLWFHHSDDRLRVEAQLVRVLNPVWNGRQRA